MYVGEMVRWDITRFDVISEIGHLSLCPALSQLNSSQNRNFVSDRHTSTMVWAILAYHIQLLFDNIDAAEQHVCFRVLRGKVFGTQSCNILLSFALTQTRPKIGNFMALTPNQPNYYILPGPDRTKTIIINLKLTSFRLLQTSKYAPAMK